MGSEYHSSLDREPEELAILAAHGHEIQGMSLQSYPFFGSANGLYQDVKAPLARRPDCRFLVFDFRLVTGIDSSAKHRFTQIKQAADDLGTGLVLVSLPPDLRRTLSPVLSDDDIIADDLDYALEGCEKEVITAHLDRGGRDHSLLEWFSQALGSADYAKQLAENCERLEFREGDIIASQGDLADRMHFILEGRIGVIVSLGDGLSTRVRSLGPHTTVGEMGLITGQARSATLQAEVDSVVYALTFEAYERLRRENRQLSQALLTYVVKVMAERLNFASKTIGVLRR
jgi:SulP family sulfate permease